MNVMTLRTKSHWLGVVLDCPNARELAHFYQRLLGWTIFNEDDDWADLAPSETAGYNLAFATEPNYVAPTWPSEPGKQGMSMHLDFEVDDLDAGTSHALNVGAALAEYQPQPDVRVFLDPAGHPFCLYVDEEN